MPDGSQEALPTMKKILVPCDFSDPAIQAFKFASEIASINNGEVFLLNIIEVPALHNSTALAYEMEFLKELKENAGKNFEKMKARWGGEAKAHLLVEHGSVVSIINKFVETKAIDLVVMGTHGAGGLREFVVGSNTEKIVRSSKVPVIAVKRASKIASIKDIIFPIHLGLDQKDLITSVKALQGFLKAKLHILHINTPVNFTGDIDTGKKLSEFVKENQFKNCTINIYNDLDTGTGIINFSSRFTNKMVAMSTHGRRGLNHFLSGSIAEDVVNHIECPIWTYAVL